MKPGHAFVLGSGIAGLAIAEILSRNGWNITLLDTASELGGDASRCTQNWFHTGWLYAALPNKAAMLGCAKALGYFNRVYGSVVPPAVLNLERTECSIGYPHSAEGWFSEERVHYLYTTATSDLSRTQQLFWRAWVHGVALRRLRALGYDASPETELAPCLIGLLNFWEGSERGHLNYTVVRSSDAQINTRRVMNTLLSLLGDKASVCSGARYSLIRNGDRTAIRFAGETHNPELVVMATGQGIAQQLVELGCQDTAQRFKSVCSPIVVLNRALDLPNFIRFTSNLPTTVNHIKYEVAGLGPRSTIGSYDYFPVDKVPDISPFANRICKRMGISTSDVADVYYGTKTEFTGSLERRYNHAVERVNANTYFAIPGKFSQFPLLAHEFSRLTGLDTERTNEARGKLNLKVALTAPELSQLHHSTRGRAEPRAKPLAGLLTLES